MKTTSKAVANWLLVGVAMLMIQVLLGGITRLTGSGLSITEWKPLMGALPPLRESEWNDLFVRYQQIAQYKILNADFTLHDFKFIYFWEWFHRNWARFMAIAFLLPFGWFIMKGQIKRAMIPDLLMLFVLGMAQGLIGWIMVASGINDTNVYVSHFRLAIHFISALVLIGFTFRLALRYRIADDDRMPIQGMSIYLWLSGTLLLIQLIYGAFMAGLKAAANAPTWPRINGDWLPSASVRFQLLHHPLAVHWVHRSLAFCLVLLLVFIFIRFYSHPNPLWQRYRFLLPLFVVVQAGLGILTVWHSPHALRNAFGSFEILALAHQAVAMLLAMLWVWLHFISRPVLRRIK